MLGNASAAWKTLVFGLHAGVAMGVVWCPKCLKMYNFESGHDCEGIRAVQKGWTRLEVWLKSFTVYNPKE